MGQWRLSIEGMSLTNSPMGSSFAFPGPQGARPATSWENKRWCQSLLWVPRLLFQRQVLESSLLSAQGWFWTYSMSLGCVSVGSGDSDSQVTLSIMLYNLGLSCPLPPMQSRSPGCPVLKLIFYYEVHQGS